MITNKSLIVASSWSHLYLLFKDARSLEYKEDTELHFPSFLTSALDGGSQLHPRETATGQVWAFWRQEKSLGPKENGAPGRPPHTYLALVTPYQGLEHHSASEVLFPFFRPHYGPGVDSAFNRYEYQEYFLGGKSVRCIGLTLPPSCADCLEIWDPRPPGTLRDCPGL